MLPEQGIYPFTVSKGSSGLDDKGAFTITVTGALADGPNKGSLMTYTGRVDNRTAKYIAQDMAACGWTGKDVLDFGAEVDAWIARTGGTTTAEIVHLDRKDKSGAFAVIRGLGRGLKVLTPATRETAADANAALRAALAVDSDDQPLPF